MAALVGAGVELPVVPPAVVAAVFVDAEPVDVVLVPVRVALLKVVLRCRAVPVAAELPPDATMPVPGRRVVVEIVELLVELLGEEVPLRDGTIMGKSEAAEMVAAEGEELEAATVGAAAVEAALVEPPVKGNGPE